MVVYNYSGKEINAKVVYYGPALSGKTTNLEWIYSKIPTEYSGKMVSLRTQADRTIFFDFLPLELGLIDGFKTRFMLYTVPGQVYYNATRKMVLKGVDGVVFVADSEKGRMEDNLESFQNLKENLAELGIDPATLPMVLQWNKRDLPDIETIEALQQQINEFRAPSFEASAPTGQGVYETLHQIAQMVYQKLTTGEAAAAGANLRGNDPAESLFGATIASKLQEIDHPIHHEKLALEDVTPDEAEDDSPVLASILGKKAAQPVAQAAQQAARPVAPQAAPRAHSSDAEDPLDSVVDQLLSQLDDETEMVNSAAQASASSRASGHTPPVAPPRPPQNQGGGGADVFLTPDEADDSVSPLIEHDADPFSEPRPSKPVQLDEFSVGTPVKEVEDEEDLQLITDPLKRSSNPPKESEENSGSISRPLGLSSAVPREGMVLEIPVTLDLEKLQEGETIQIVLTLRA